MAPIKPHPTEAIAAKHLAQKGLTLLEQNYHSRFGDALASVDQRKQQKIILTAQHYLSTHFDDSPCRFDVVALDKDHQIQWVKDAFNAG